MRTVSGGGIDLRVDDVDGGKITSVIVGGREWIAPSFPRDPSARYGGAGGWDECVPTVGECTLANGTRLLDHGDAWRRPWEVVDSEPDLLDMTVGLPSLDLTLRRTIQRSASGLTFRYSVTTRSAEDVPLLWSAHPLFIAPRGTRIVVRNSRGTEHYPRHRRRRVPLRGSIDRIRSGTALKMFLTWSSSWAAVEHADGARLTMSWDPARVRELGLYWDAGVFATHSVVAIEPTTGAHDLASAVTDRLPHVNVRRPLSWWLHLAYSPPRTARYGGGAG
ncbi:MAG TPA: hypothetical protein VNR36_02315 [Pseudolysinimonas sp.]|nr:hypothetical protein [Pseudolysinimonas sp.]